MSIKRISGYLVLILMIFVFTLAGCSERNDVTRGSEDNFGGLNSEELLSSEDYTNLGNLLGNLTVGELMDILDESLQTLNALGAQGKTSPGDYETLLCILTNMYNKLAADKAEFEETGGSEGAGMAEASDALIELIGMMAENRVGDILRDLFNQTGFDVLVENIYPMLAYLMAADTSALEGAVGGITLPDIAMGAIGREDFDDMIAKVHDALAEGGLLDTLIAKLDEFKNGDSKITVGDIKAIINTIMDVAGTGTATEDLLYSISLLLGNENDLAAILDGAEDLLDPAVVDRGDFETFVASALQGLAPVADADTLEGLLGAISGIDPAYIPGLGDGVAQLITRNMYGQPLIEDPDVITSELRTLIFMMDSADYEPKMLRSLALNLGYLDIIGLVTDLFVHMDFNFWGLVDSLVGLVSTLVVYGDIPVLSLMESPDGVVDNYNLAQWCVGEVVTALDSHPDMTQFEAFDWVLYEKKYTMLGMMSFNGIVEMMTSPVVSILMNTLGLITDEIFDPFPAFVELAGGDSSLLFDERNGTAGTRHQIFALFAPLMQYFWDAGKPGDMIAMLSHMNEIDDYVPLCKGGNATFRVDDQGVALKTLEPVLATLLNPRAADDKGIVGPALDLVISILSTLDTELAHDGTTLFDAVMFELKPYLNFDLDAEAQQKILDALFGPDSTVLDDAKTFLEENRDTILDISGSLGDIDKDAFTELIDYFTEEDNDLVNNTKILVCKVLDIKDADYNPTGTITDESTLKDILIHLLGDEEQGIDGIYDFAPLKNFLLAVTDNPDLLWTLIGGLIGGDAEPEEGLLAGCPGISLDFIRALFACVDVDGDGNLDDSVVLGMMKLINLDVDYNSLLHELADLLSGADLKPDSDMYNMLLNALELVVENSYING